MTIDAIPAIGGNIQTSQELFIANQPAVSPANFGDLLDKGLVKLNDEIINADKLMVDYVLDKNVSTHDLMIAMEKAKHSMQLAVEVRNRLVEAYQKITSMQA